MLMSSKEISMESRLSLIRATVDKLHSDPELRSRLEGRELGLYVAVSEALANAITHGNHSDPSRKVYVRYTRESDDELSILIRDEGSRFNAKRHWRKPESRNLAHEVVHG
jgi:anti-sigma regulatory factor (Ser/Thr protein kinase)